MNQDLHLVSETLLPACLPALPLTLVRWGWGDEEEDDKDDAANFPVYGSSPRCLASVISHLHNSHTSLTLSTRLQSEKAGSKRLSDQHHTASKRHIWDASDLGLSSVEILDLHLSVAPSPQTNSYLFTLFLIPAPPSACGTSSCSLRATCYAGT